MQVFLFRPDGAQSIESDECLANSHRVKPGDSRGHLPRRVFAGQVEE